MTISIHNSSTRPGIDLIIIIIIIIIIKQFGSISLLIIKIISTSSSRGGDAELAGEVGY
jgi:hypothetical protein